MWLLYVCAISIHISGHITIRLTADAIKIISRYKYILKKCGNEQNKVQWGLKEVELVRHCGASQHTGGGSLGGKQVLCSQSPSTATSCLQRDPAHPPDIRCQLWWVWGSNTVSLQEEFMFWARVKGVLHQGREHTVKKQTENASNKKVFMVHKKQHDVPSTLDWKGWNENSWFNQENKD